MTESQLDKKVCTACTGDEPPLKGDELIRYTQQIDDGWDVVDEHHIVRKYEFSDYKETIDFVNAVAEESEEQNHHPIMLVEWGKATITIYTHKIDGLTENDFILAARCDAKFKEMAKKE